MINTSTTSLVVELDGIAQSIAQHVVRASEILTELRRRKVHHPFMTSSLLRHHKGITDGLLSPTAVVALGGNSVLISAIKSLPISQQEHLASGAGVDVIEMTPEGNLVTVTRPIMELSAPALERVFGEFGLRSLAEQTALFGNGTDRTRINGIIVDRSEVELVFGRKRVKPNDLIAPLKALGYELKKSETAQ